MNSTGKGGWGEGVSVRALGRAAEPDLYSEWDMRLVGCRRVNITDSDCV